MNTATASSSPALPDAAYRLDGQLCFALYAAHLAMNKVYRPLLSDLGLTYPQYLVMLVLWEHDGLTVSALGARLHLDSATLTPLLKRLQTAGLVTRSRDPEDERQVRIGLTDAGRTLQHRARSVPEGAICATGCAPNELDTLKQELETLRERLVQHITLD